MAPKFKMPMGPMVNTQPRQQSQQQEPTLSVARIGIPFAPIGIPPGMPVATHINRVRQHSAPPPLAMPGADLERAVNYYADYGGCGFWRMIWPENLLNGYQKGIINGLTTMVLDEKFYQGIRSVRLQRQATPMQLAFVKFLKEGAKQHGFKVIYEIDDIIFKDDIPDFNRCKVAFDNPEILQSAIEMMQLADEVSVTCQYMKDYYIEKTGNKKITIIPNYAPKGWADRFYDESEISKRFDQYKKHPRIGYCGSGTHIDVTNKTNQNDDFSHIVKHIINTRKKYKWVMMGCYPLPLKPFIDNGDIEYAQWASIFNYPEAMHALKLNAVIAPLKDCHFNRAKSNIKFLEAAYQGLPGVFQDMVTYKDAPLRFKTGDELVDQLDYLLKDKSRYMKISKKSRQYAETMWLDNHLDEYSELYFTNWSAPNRKALLINNPDQKNS